MNFVFSSDADVGGRRIAGGGNAPADGGEGQLQLFRDGLGGKFDVGGESVAVEDGRLDKLNSRRGSALTRVVGDVAGDGGANFLKGGLRFFAVSGEKVEGDLGVENALSDGTERKKAGGLAFEFIDGELVAFGNGWEKHGDRAQRRKFCQSGGDGAADDDSRAW